MEKGVADVFYIARQKGTERPWTSKFENFKEVGTCTFSTCGNPLFKSNTKFDMAVAGPAFMNQLVKKVLFTLRTIPTVWHEPKHNVSVGARLTWAMFLKMDLLLPASVIVLMVWCLIFLKLKQRKINTTRIKTSKFWTACSPLQSVSGARPVKVDFLCIATSPR